MGQVLSPTLRLGLAELKYGDFILILENKYVPSNFKHFFAKFYVHFL